MKYRLFIRLVLLLSLFAFLSCADRQPKPTQEDQSIKKITTQTYHTFNSDECQPVNQQGMVKKVDNFVVIFDPSASMTETYETSGDCIECNQDYLYSKFQFAKQLASCFNQSIPDIELVGALRTFGYPVYSRLAHGPKDYEKEIFERNLKKIFDADGASPLAPTLNDVSKDLFDLPGKKAVIVISDGEDMSQKEVLAAEELKERYGDDICIYTIHIGNDPAGKKIMKDIAIAGQCGLSIEGDRLLSRKEMDNFVREIFLTKDSDGDGVPDLKDDCPDTLPGLEVDENGCWKLIALGNVLFDFDKYNLKPEGIKMLDQVTALLKKHEFLDLHISGHTDNFGSMEYNITLSKNRVQSGLKYLKNKGISPERLSISWHSYSIPAAANTNSAGRALNRRLEFKFKKRQK